jgi:hypothetical protein
MWMHGEMETTSILHDHFTLCNESIKATKLSELQHDKVQPILADLPLESYSTRQSPRRGTYTDFEFSERNTPEIWRYRYETGRRQVIQKFRRHLEILGARRVS